MPNPSNTTITIDGLKLNAFSTQIGLSSHVSAHGMPAMGTMQVAIDFSADMHDTDNVPFATVKSLFDLANLPTRDKVKDIKLEFWQDDSKTDALLTVTFQGWVSHWHVASGGGSNHILTVSLQPILNDKSYHDFQLGN